MIVSIDQLTTEIIAAAIPSLITIAINRFPKNLLNGKISKSINISEEFRTNCDEYLNRLSTTCMNISTLALRNQQVTLPQLYYPMSISQTNYQKGKGESTLRIEDVPNQITEKGACTLISDYAGMGKSTLLKWICIKLILSGTHVPVFYELRRLGKRQKLVSEIKKIILCGRHSIDDATFIEILQSGNFVVMFDGFDEIPNANRNNAVSQVKEFIKLCSKNAFILTSRPEDGLSSFSEFLEYRINPLEYNESIEVLLKYATINNNKDISSLIHMLKTKHEQINEFLHNPFMVSLLFLTYVYHFNIPSSKACFYDEVYNALYKYHDLSKDYYEREKKSKLGIDTFRKLVSELAYSSMKANVVEYSGHKLYDQLEHIVSSGSAFTCSAEEFIHDLLHSVPLMVKDGLFTRWAHKSFLDFFSATYICRSVQRDEIIKRLVDSNKGIYNNVLSFIGDMEHSAFQSGLIVPVLNSFVKQFDSCYSNPGGIDEENITRYWEVFVSLNPLIKISSITTNIESSVLPLFNDYTRRYPDRLYASATEHGYMSALFAIAYGYNNNGHLLPLIYSFNPELFVPVSDFRSIDDFGDVFSAITHDLTMSLSDSELLKNSTFIEFFTNFALFYCNLRHQRRPYILNVTECRKFLEQYYRFQRNKADDLDGL